MERAVAFAKAMFNNGMVLWRRGDPVLMGAAIAYNALFALVPLAIVFVSIVTLFDGSNTFFETLIGWLHTTMPPKLAGFLAEILQQSIEFVSGKRIALVVISALVALWSGSRAVYAIQKSLRLVQGSVDECGYLRARLTGIMVTVAGGVAIMAGYAAVLIGENVWQEITDVLNLPSVGVTRTAAVLVSLLWAFALLHVIYRFGPPQPLEFAAVNAGIVTVILYLGTLVAGALVPSVSNPAVALLGSVGVVLLWLYFVGLVIVALPLGTLSLLAVLDKPNRQ